MLEGVTLIYRNRMSCEHGPFRAAKFTKIRMKLSVCILWRCHRQKRNTPENC